MVEQIIQRLRGGSVLAECGPMRLVISAWIGKLAQCDIAVRAAEEAFVYLEAVAEARSSLRRIGGRAPDKRKHFLVERMIESVSAVGDEDLTPMAAVAGTIADGVAEFLFARGMTKVVVENGGDISVRLESDEFVTVGIRPEVGFRKISHIIALGSERRSWGVATSGLGGRSLTRGVASGVTTVARTASLADAAATAVANASFVEDTQVIRRPAEEVDPYTDIPGLFVTVKAGVLNEAVKNLAVERAMSRAEELVSKDVILGAFVAVQGKIGMTQFVRDRLVKEVQHRF
ncbi:MAG: UPF0280 family protein [Deltaproteobacteria bacterium]|nr:UPF0280 family protein [Deltaproteobacteria bacterium]